MSYQKYIEIKGQKGFGQPCIINTRITVFDILSRLASEVTVEEIIRDFSELKEDHIKAALSFAAEREHILELHRDTFFDQNISYKITEFL